MLAEEQYVWWTVEEDYVRIPLAFVVSGGRRLKCLKPVRRFVYDSLSGADVYYGAPLILLLRKELDKKWVTVHTCRLPQHICNAAALVAKEVWSAGGWKEDVAEAVESLRFS